MSKYRANTDLRGHTVVEANLPCINGLAAWVMVADLGKPEPEDEMFGGLDRDAMAERIVAALDPTDGFRLVPIEPPHSLAPLLTAYSLDERHGWSGRDQAEIIAHLRTRWAAILAAVPAGVDVPGEGKK